MVSEGMTALHSCLPVSLGYGLVLQWGNYYFDSYQQMSSNGVKKDTGQKRGERKRLFIGHKEFPMLSRGYFTGFGCHAVQRRLSMGLLGHHV